MNQKTAVVNDGSVQRVIRELSAQIYRGKIKPGETVGEAEIAEQLGVSRTPVREALGQLVVRGLLEKEQGRSARVRRPSLAELVDLYDLRILLESTAAAQAADRRSDTQLERLVELEAELLVCPEEDWLDVHRAFHVLIAESAKRPKLTQIVEDLRAQSEVYIWLGRLDTGRQDEAPHEHHQIMAAIRDGDGAAAHDRMVTHLQNTVATVTDIAHRTNGLIIPLE